MSFCRLIFTVIAIYSFNSNAGEVSLFGQEINAAIPAEYCEIGDSAADAEVVRLTKEGIGGSNQILTIFADCKELKDFRMGKGFLRNYGNILAQTANGNPRHIKGVSRAYFIQKISSQSGDISEAMQKAEVKIKQFEPSFKINVNLGLLSTDSNGLYTGFLSTVSHDENNPKSIVAVSGLTLIREIPISINIYHVYSKSPDLSGLLARNKTSIANLINLNN